MTLPVSLRRAAPWCLAALLAACAAGGGSETATAGGAARRYEMRGVVTRVPDPPQPQADLVIRHEAVDDFVGIDGEAVGMDSMTMELPVADGVPFGAVEAGDKVAFTLEVTWRGDLPFRIVAIEELPADTALEFRKARRPDPLGGGASPAEPANESPATPPEEDGDAETQG